MAISKWSELDTALDNWLNRTDLTSVIPDFVRLFESRVDREIRHVRMMQRATATVDAQYLSLPEDWLEPISLRLTTSPVTELQSVTPEVMVAWRAENTANGTPTHYAITGTSLEFLPSPDASYTIEMLYWERLSKLDSTDADSVNWMLTYYPDVYLFGALCEAELYIHDDDRVRVWQAKLEQALIEMRREAVNAQIGSTPKRRFKAIG